MSSGKLSGLNQNASGYWILDKQVDNHRIYKSTRKKNYADAERIAIKWIADAENRIIHGIPEQITFRQAATLYLQRESKKSIGCDANDLKKVMPYIGDMLLDKIHNESLNQYKEDQLQHGGQHGTGAKGTTINRSLRIVSRVLRLAAQEWRDDQGRPYLQTQPIIRSVSENDKTLTRPAEYFEEKLLLTELNERFADLWTFACHTGLREQTQANLRWDWERSHPRIKSKLFVIPSQYLKYGKNISSGDWLLVLDSTASGIVERWRGRSEEFVFPNPSGDKYYRLRGKHFNSARKRLGLEHLNWHSARATFSTRLRSLGVSEEDRRYLMAHDTGSITSQYSWADIHHLVSCVERLCSDNEDHEEGVFSLDSLRKVRR